MLKFVNEETGKTVMTEQDNGKVDFHLTEDKKKATEQGDTDKDE